jgi:hypothetical protein
VATKLTQRRLPLRRRFHLLRRAALRAAPAIACSLAAACSGSGPSPPSPPPAPGPGQAVGWTMLAPSIDTMHVFVSSSAGSDQNSGLSEESPKATIQAAVSLLRQGCPDWLHVKRGDRFTGGLGDWFLSGRSQTEPMVVTSFGPAAERPLFLCGSESGVTVHGFPVHDVAFVGLHFLADGYDGGESLPYGVSLLQPCTRLLIEDCLIEHFFTNLRFQGAHHDLKLRRSVVADAFTVTASHAEGIYVDGVDGCLIEECVFDHNGWLTSVPGADPDIYRHDIYIQGNTSNIAIRGNIVARAGSHGLQARSGGDVRDNLFLANPINLLVGNNIENDGAVTATVIGNVMLDGRDINPREHRGWAAQFQCLASAEIAYNVAAHHVAGSAPRSFEFDSTLGVGVNNVDCHHNVSYRWGAPVLLVGTRFSGLTLRNNDFQETGAILLLYANAELPMPGIVSTGNRLFTLALENQWIFYVKRTLSLSAWSAIVGDDTSIATQVDYPRPEETIADYDRALGGDGSAESFLGRARRQSMTAWDERLTGTSAAARFRADFGIATPR